MLPQKLVIKLLQINCVILVLIIFFAKFGRDIVAVAGGDISYSRKQTVIIDPGHGAPDGGATSCTGVLESDLNLEIGLRLNDLCTFLGIKTVLTRNDESSIYTTGDTIAKKKISDLKNRVSLINTTQNAIVLSIHQNHFYDSRYSGAQVFYADSDDSQALAKALQADLVATLNPGSNRKAKSADGVYLMEHINCTGVLIECGFLSNPTEENKLRSQQYQKELCCVIATGCVRFINGRLTS